MPMGAPSKSSRKIASPNAISNGVLRGDSGEGRGLFMQSDKFGTCGGWWFARILFSRLRSNGGTCASGGKGFSERFAFIAPIRELAGEILRSYYAKTHPVCRSVF